MKKLCILFAALFFITNLQSQDIQAGAEAGLNLSFASAKEPGVTFHGSPGIRYALGGFMDVALTDKRFSFRPSLLFSREAYRPILYGDKTPIAISYISIPLPVIYHSELLEHKLFFGFGPYLAYALSGKYTNRGATTKIEWGTDPAQDDGKRLDIGLDFRVGYELQKDLFLTMKFDLGLKQIATETDVKVHTRNLGITAAYLLWNNKK